MQVLGPSDGRQQLTGVARSLCEQVQQHRLTSRDVDINLLNNRLIGTLSHWGPYYAHNMQYTLYACTNVAMYQSQ